MSRNRSLNDPVEAWLRDQPLSEIPDRLVRSIVDDARRTSQQRTVFGWRPLPMYRTLSIVATGAVAIVIALAGASLIGTGGSTGPGGAPSSAPNGSGPAESPRSSGPPPAPRNPITGLPGRFAFAADWTGDLEIYAMRPDGSGVTRLTDDPADDREPAWSPDGSKIAFTRFDSAGAGVWIMDADGGDPYRLENGGQAQWSFDGQRIVAQDDEAIYAIDPDGTDRANIINEPTAGLIISGPSWLADGSGILFIGSPGEGLGSDVYRVRLDGSDLKQLTATEGEDASPRMSPDGQRIAFERNRICVCSIAPDGSEPTELGTWLEKGAPLSWSPDSQWIATAGGSHGPQFIHVLAATGGEDRVATDTGDYIDVSWGP